MVELGVYRGREMKLWVNPWRMTKDNGEVGC